MAAPSSEPTLRLSCGAERGTAFLVGESHALTSLHCVVEHLDDSSVAIEVTSPSHPDPIRCEIVDVGIPTSEDAVLLKLATSCPSATVPPLVGSHVPAGLTWTASGYPHVRGSLGARLSGTTSRSINPDLAAWDIELICDSSSVLASYEGASGAPVIVGGAVRAMLQQSIDGALGALSLRRLQGYLRSAGIEFAIIGGGSTLPARLRAQLPHARINALSAAGLESAILERGAGYVMLSGTPGSGKSLLVAGFDPVSPTLEVVGRYFAGEPDANSGSPALQRLPRTFADWLCQEAALISPDAVAVARDASTADCATAIAANLRAISEALAKRDAVGVILIDDAVGGSDQSRASLLEALPVVPPDNVAIVLTTTSEEAMASAMPDATFSRKERMVPLARRDAEAVAAHLLPDDAPHFVAMKIAAAAKGHPLVLTLLARQHNAGAVEDIETTGAAESVELNDYYERVWSRIAKSGGASVWLLATLSCLRGTVSESELLEMTPVEQRTEFPVGLAAVRHLLHEGQTGLDFYHDSFRTFVVAKVAALAGSIHARLRDYAAGAKTDYAKCNRLFHQLEANAGARPEDLAACDQDFFDQAALVCGDPELLLEDLTRVLELAIASGDFVETTRLLLLRNRVRFRYNVVFAEFAYELSLVVMRLRSPAQAIAFLHRQGVFVCGPYLMADLLRRLCLRGEEDVAEDFFQRFRIRCWAAYESGDANWDLLLAHVEAAAAIATSRPATAIPEIKRLRRVFEAQFRDNPNADSVGAMRAHFNARFGAESLWRLGAIGPLQQQEETAAQYAILIGLLLTRLKWLRRTYGDQTHPPRPEGFQFWDAQTLANQLETVCRTATFAQEVPDVVESLIEYGRDPALVGQLWRAPARSSLREANGVDFNQQALDDEFAIGRVEGYCGHELKDAGRLIREPWEARFLEMARLLGRIGGEAAGRRREAALVEQDVLTRLRSEVWTLQRFTLLERASWKDSYAIPEGASTAVARLTAEVVGDFAPSLIGEVVAHYLGLPDQCGLYTEGYRGVLRALARRLASVAHDKRLVADLVRACVRHVADNVFNRSERVGEFLACAAIAGDANADQLAEEAFVSAVGSSLGPSWYKEAQFSLLTDVIEEARDPALVRNIWPSVVTSLELACGETTFQRFVRYEKQRLVGLLAEAGDLSTAVSLYFHYVLPPLEVQAQRIERLTVDHTTRWMGSRFGVCEIDEQAGILQLFGGLEDAGARRRWGLVELFWPGDDRHGEDFATHARRALAEDNGDQVYNRALRFLRADADEKSRAKYLEQLEASEDDRTKAFVAGARAAGLGGSREPKGKVLPPPAQETNHDGGDQDGGLRVPGVFGDPRAIQEMEQKTAEARLRLERGDGPGARHILVEGLRAVLDAEWGIWDGSRAEELALLWESGDVVDVTRSLTSLIRGSRFSLDWMVVAGLLPAALPRMTPEQRSEVVAVITDHINTILRPESRAMKVADEVSSFRRLEPIPSADSAVDHLLVELLDHPNANTRDRAADVVFWLLSCDRGALLERLTRRIGHGVVGHGREIAAGILHAFATSGTARAVLVADALEAAAVTDDRNMLVRYALGASLRSAGREPQASAASREAPSANLESGKYAWQLDPRILELLGPLRENADECLRGLCAPFGPEDVKVLVTIRETAFNGRRAFKGNPWEREAAFRVGASVEADSAGRELTRAALWNPLWPEAHFDYRATSRRSELLTALQVGDIPTVLEHDDQLVLHLVEFEVADKKLTELEIFAVLVSDAYFDGHLDHARAREIASVHEHEGVSALPSSLVSLTTPAIRAFEMGTMVGGDVTPSFPAEVLVSGMRLQRSDFNRVYWHERRVWRPWGAGPLPSFGAMLLLPKNAVRTVPGYDLVWVVRKDGVVAATVDVRRRRVFWSEA